MEIKIEDLLEIIGDLSKENALSKMQMKTPFKKTGKRGSRKNESNAN